MLAPSTENVRCQDSEEEQDDDDDDDDDDEIEFPHFAAPARAA